MDFVDHEHCLRLRRSGFKIAVVRDSRMAHALGEPSKQRFLGKTKHWSDHEPWREYYVTRNEIYTIWRYYSDPVTKALVLYRMMRRATGILLFGKHKKSCLQMMLQGMIDGRAGRPGKKHLPGAAN